MDLARSLLEDHGFEEVVWTDTDVVWLRDPRPYLALHPAADLAIQTDCLSHAVEANVTGPFQHGVARCGHLPGNTFNNAFNTGATPAAGASEAHPSAVRCRCGSPRTACRPGGSLLFCCPRLKRRRSNHAVLWVQA